MDSYAVALSAEFNRRISEIERDALGFGARQTANSILEIINRCDGLAILPHRRILSKRALNSHALYRIERFVVRNKGDLWRCDTAYHLAGVDSLVN